MMLPRFSDADLERANREWGCNCGPGAIAAICGLTLDQLRPHMGDFESKNYTNPTLMWQILDRIGARWRRSRETWPRWGLVRVQWDGPWTAPRVPARAAYRHTHWIGACSAADGRVGIFDVNAFANGTGWCALEDWERVIVPYILEECVPRANGKWRPTHVVEVVA